MTDTIRTNTLFSIIWSVLSRWSSKLIGMISTIVLARLLTPADFGVIAMATLVIALLDAMTQAGLNLYILRLKKESDSEYNSVWTVSILQGVLIATCLVLMAPYIAKFYQQPNLIDVIYCLALVRVMYGFNNVGLLIAQKHLNFKLDFIHTLYTRITYFIVTVGFAVYFRDYWAIVAGMIVSGLVGIVSSYILHPFRPRLSFRKLGKLLQYSKSTVPLSVGRYVNNQADSLVVGRFASVDFLGLYHIATNLAGMFTKELLIPVIRGLVPNLSKLREQANFHQVLRLTFSSAIYVFLPVGIGLSLVSYEFVYVLLGESWLSAVPLLFWFSLYGMLGGVLMFYSEQFLVMMVKEKLSNQLMWLRNSVPAGVILYTLLFASVSELPRNLFFGVLMSLPLVLFFMCRSISFPLLILVKDWLRPLTAVSIMCIALLLIPMPVDSPLALLCVKVCFGATSYITTLVLLARVFGIPDNSIESMVHKRLFVDRITPSK